MTKKIAACLEVGSNGTSAFVQTAQDARFSDVFRIANVLQAYSRLGKVY